MLFSRIPVFVLLSLTTMIGAQDLETTKRERSEINTLAASPCGDGATLSSSQKTQLDTDIADVLKQLKSAKDQVSSLKQLDLSAGDTTTIDAQIKALSSSADACAKAKSLA